MAKLIFLKLQITHRLYAKLETALHSVSLYFTTNYLPFPKLYASLINTNHLNINSIHLRSLFIILLLVKLILYLVTYILYIRMSIRKIKYINNNLVVHCIHLQNIKQMTLTNFCNIGNNCCTSLQVKIIIIIFIHNLLLYMS